VALLKNVLSSAIRMYPYELTMLELHNN